MEFGTTFYRDRNNRPMLPGGTIATPLAPRWVIGGMIQGIRATMPANETAETIMHRVAQIEKIYRVLPAACKVVIKYPVARQCPIVLTATVGNTPVEIDMPDQVATPHIPAILAMAAAGYQYTSFASLLFPSSFDTPSVIGNRQIETWTLGKRDGMSQGVFWAFDGPSRARLDAYLERKGQLPHAVPQKRPATAQDVARAEELYNELRTNLDRLFSHAAEQQRKEAAQHAMNVSSVGLASSPVEERLTAFNDALDRARHVGRNTKAYLSELTAKMRGDWPNLVAEMPPNVILAVWSCSGVHDMMHEMINLSRFATQRRERDADGTSEDDAKHAAGWQTVSNVIPAVLDEIDNTGASNCLSNDMIGHSIVGALQLAIRQMPNGNSTADAKKFIMLFRESLLRILDKLAQYTHDGGAPMRQELHTLGSAVTPRDREKFIEIVTQMIRYTAQCGLNVFGANSSAVHESKLASVRHVHAGQRIVVQNAIQSVRPFMHTSTWDAATPDQRTKQINIVFDAYMMVSSGIVAVENAIAYANTATALQIQRRAADDVPLQKLRAALRQMREHAESEKLLHEKVMEQNKKLKGGLYDANLRARITTALLYPALDECHAAYLEERSVSSALRSWIERNVKELPPDAPSDPSGDFDAAGRPLLPASREAPTKILHDLKAVEHEFLTRFARPLTAAEFHDFAARATADQPAKHKMLRQLWWALRERGIARGVAAPPQPNIDPQAPVARLPRYLTALSGDQLIDAESARPVTARDIQGDDEYEEDAAVPLGESDVESEHDYAWEGERGTLDNPVPGDD